LHSRENTEKIKESVFVHGFLRTFRLFLAQLRELQRGRRSLHNFCRNDRKISVCLCVFSDGFCDSLAMR
jgi:hypothetical protein